MKDDDDNAGGNKRLDCVSWRMWQWHQWLRLSKRRVSMSESGNSAAGVLFLQT